MTLVPHFSSRDPF